MHLHDPVKWQCYWYASAIYQTVYAEYPQSIEDVKAKSKLGKYIVESGLVKVMDEDYANIKLRWTKRREEMAAKQSTTNVCQ